MNEIQISVAEECSALERDLIVRAMVGCNESRAPSECYRDLCILARHRDEVVAGLLGYTHWSWLFVKQLWRTIPLATPAIFSRSATYMKPETSK